MANFVTADDKRIYDLLQELNPGLDWSLPIDLPGKIGASRITISQLLNLLSGSGSKQDANAGTTNPDNTLGNVGDFYYKIPADGSSLTLFKKVSSNSWATVFNLPISGGTSGQLYRVFLIPSSDITDGSVNITGRTNEQGDTVIPSDANVSVYEGGKIVPATYSENGLIEGLDGSLDVKIVLIGGEPVVQAGNFTLNNESSVPVSYGFDNYTDSLPSNNEITGNSNTFRILLVELPVNTTARIIKYTNNELTFDIILTGGVDGDSFSAYVDNGTTHEITWTNS